MTTSETSKRSASVSGLLHEIRETQSDFAVIRAELKLLHENVKSISALVRDGNGDTSILTRLALLSQKIDDMQRWMDGHRSAHEKLKNDINDVRKEFDELKVSQILIDKDVSQYRARMASEEEITLDRIKKAEEFAHAQKMSHTKVNEERQKLLLKILGVIILAAITFFAGQHLR